MFNWSKGFGWKRSANLTGRAGQLDSLGAAVKILSSYGKKLSVENLEVLLAIGALGVSGEWVSLRELKSKLPGLSSYQLSRSLSALSAKGSMIEALFSTKDALIQTRIYEPSQREKEVSLTEYGLLILNRSIQAISAGFSVKMPPRGDGGVPGLFKLVVSGDTPNGKKVHFETKRLLSVGHIGTGVVESSFGLCGQAIAQGATLYWLGLCAGSRAPVWLYSLAEMHARNHNFYMSGDVKCEYIAVCPREVFDSQGICYHSIDAFKAEPADHEQRVIDSLNEIATAVEQQSNIAGAFLVIESNNIKRYTKGAQYIKRLLSAGVGIHIIDGNFDAEGGDEVLSAMKELGFDIADYRFEKTGFGKSGIMEKTGVYPEGHAWFTGKDTQGVLLKMDYVSIPFSKTIVAANIVKKEPLTIAGKEI